MHIFMVQGLIKKESVFFFKTHFSEVVIETAVNKASLQFKTTIQKTFIISLISSVAPLPVCGI